MGKLADAFIEISSSDAKLNAGLETAKAKLTQFTTGANSLLGTIGLGLGAAGFVKFLQDATMKGSDLNETMSKVEQVFGKASGTVTGMANEMADKFGSVKGVTLDAAANLGLVAQGAGMSAQAAADMSVKLTKLADDASSFYNVPLAVALEKIRSGMVGEAEPLRAFGVLLSEANMKSAALAMGIQPVKGEFTEQEKVMARVKIITEGLSKAQGDHARTMDGYANQIRKLTGQWENYKAGIGAAMAGAEANIMATVQNKGILAALGQATMQAHAQGGLQKNTGEDIFQKAADAAAGVQVGLKPTPKVSPMETYWQNRAANDAAYQQRKTQESIEANQGGGFGALGLPGSMSYGIMMSMQRGALDVDIQKRQKKMNEWSGGHVMDTESFMKQAQEKLLEKRDEVAEKQLKELIEMRKSLDKIASPPPAKQQGMVLKGREQ